jgi:PTS system fructose-specific IIC component
LVENGALLYALAILVGSVVSALLIGFIKKPVK